MGSTQQAREEVSQAVEQPVAQLQEQLPQQAILNVDETGWRTNGDKRWIWALVASQFVFYTVAVHRNTDVLVSLLGAVFRGILCSDRFSAYLKYHSGKMQLCRAPDVPTTRSHSLSPRLFLSGNTGDSGTCPSTLL